MYIAEGFLRVFIVASVQTVTPYSPVGVYHATYITWPNSHPNRFDSEDRSSMSLRNIGIHLQAYKVSNPKLPQSVRNVIFEFLAAMDFF
jgi:hypothetical protein